MRRKFWWIAGAVLVVGVVPGIGEAITPIEEGVAEETTEVVETVEPTPEPTTEEPEPTPTPTPTAEPDPDLESPDAEIFVVTEVEGVKAADVLETLEVKGRAPKTGYDRDEFGQRWADTNRNGCDTRNDILNRDLTDVTYKPGTYDCVVLTGDLVSPYTRELINFQRGNDTSNEVQIDHVVALSDAWQKGAQQMTFEDRTLFANDPLNLLAVDGPSNAQKGDGDAATWLPANKSYRCEYVARQVGVKAKYGLWVTPAEKTAITSILDACPDQLIPESDVMTVIEVKAPEPTPEPTTAAPAPSPTPAPAPAAAPTQAPAPAPAAAPAPAPAAEVYYANCTEARAAGAAPIYEGQPGYRAAMDRDGDGVACE